MASINYATREISCKIVYYGPGLSGKTTNLQIIHRKIPDKDKSEMVSLATETDRTLFFDFLPLDLGSIKGFSTKFQLYTVPGQVYYNATRKLVLRGVDGVVFVVDSQVDKLQENLESFANLQENLREYGHSIENIPLVLQYNKRDLPNVYPIEQLNSLINKYRLPHYEAVAATGVGVFTTLKAIGKSVIDKFNAKYAGFQGTRRPARPGDAPAGSRAAGPASPPRHRPPRRPGLQLRPSPGFGQAPAKPAGQPFQGGFSRIHPRPPFRRVPRTARARRLTFPADSGSFGALRPRRLRRRLRQSLRRQPPGFPGAPSPGRCAPGRAHLRSGSRPAVSEIHGSRRFRRASQPVAGFGMGSPNPFAEHSRRARGSSPKPSPFGLAPGGQPEPGPVPAAGFPFLSRLRARSPRRRARGFPARGFPFRRKQTRFPRVVRVPAGTRSRAFPSRPGTSGFNAPPGIPVSPFVESFAGSKPGAPNPLPGIPGMNPPLQNPFGSAGAPPGYGQNSPSLRWAACPWAADFPPRPGSSLRKAASAARPIPRPILECGGPARFNAPGGFGNPPAGFGARRPGSRQGRANSAIRRLRRSIPGRLRRPNPMAACPETRPFPAPPAKDNPPFPSLSMPPSPPTRSPEQAARRRHGGQQRHRDHLRGHGQGRFVQDQEAAPSQRQEEGLLRRPLQKREVGMGDFVLYKEDIDRINKILSHLITESASAYVLLINKDGNLISQVGFSPNINVTSLAALAAGSFASTKAIATLIGETEFSVMFHQGDNQNIHISLVDEDVIMVLIFDDRTNLGLVKMIANQAKSKLGYVLKRREEQRHPGRDAGSAGRRRSGAGQARPALSRRQIAPSSRAGRSTLAGTRPPCHPNRTVSSPSGWDYARASPHPPNPRPMAKAPTLKPGASGTRTSSPS